MTTEVQLTLLQDDDTAAAWPCPNCHGTRHALRLLYPDERTPGGPFTTWAPCRTCQQTGTVPYNPDDHSVYPY